MQLSPALRQSLWRARDWAAGFHALEVKVQTVSDPAQRAAQAMELAQLCEYIVPDRRRAIDLYMLAWKATSDVPRALARIRFLCRELARLDMIAKVAELEHKHTKNPECLAIAGRAWLDAGEPDRAVKPLVKAARALPDDADTRAALESARREWTDAQALLAELQTRGKNADPENGARAYLQAARILAMLKTDDPALERCLWAAVNRDPRNESANSLLDLRLFQHERWDDAVALWERRAEAAVTPYERVDTLRRGGMALALRANQPERGVALVVRALTTAYDEGVADVPGHVAMLVLLRDLGQAAQMLALCGRALAGPLSDDERLAIALLAGQTAWHSFADYVAASAHIAVVKELEPTHPLPAEFDLANAVRQASEAIDLPPPADAAPPPPEPAEIETLELEPDAPSETELAIEDIEMLELEPDPPSEAAIIAQPAPTLHVPPPPPAAASAAVRALTQAAERRVAPRAVAAAPMVLLSAAVTVQGGVGAAMRGFTRDISRTGVFIATQTPLPMRSKAKLTLHLPGEDDWSVDTHETEVMVVRIEPGVGFGAEFTDPSETLEAAIDALVASQKAG